jgi:hypothetical protein
VSPSRSKREVGVSTCRRALASGQVRRVCNVFPRSGRRREQLCYEPERTDCPVVGRCLRWLRYEWNRRWDWNCLGTPGISGTCSTSVVDIISRVFLMNQIVSFFDHWFILSPYIYFCIMPIEGNARKRHSHSPRLVPRLFLPSNDEAKNIQFFIKIGDIVTFGLGLFALILSLCQSSLSSDL